MRDVILGLGSNLGDRLGNLARALDEIEGLGDMRLIAVSEVVETEPWGVADQPPFANAVARFVTHAQPIDLLRQLKAIEARLGRTAGVRFGPRVIDIDILLVGSEELHTDELTVPHPRLAERDFALTPLLEVAPNATHPDGRPFDRSAAVHGRIVRRLGPVPRYEHLTSAPEQRA